MAKGGSRAHAWIRHFNRAAVMTTIRRHGAVSRPVIEQETNLAFPTIMQITNSLIEDGMVIETDIGPSSGGRPPKLLSIRRDFGFAVGLKVQDGRVSAAVVDFCGQILSRHGREVDTSSAPQALLTIADFARTLIGTQADGYGAILGVGLAVPGVVDSATGTMRSSPLLGWAQVEVAEIFRSAVSHPVWVDNDVNVLAQDHALFGLGQRTQNFLVLTLGRGVGLGIAVDGRVYRGLHGGAGEIGHIPWPGGTEVCSCGQVGCLETIFSDHALSRRYQAESGRSISPEKLRALARTGDAEAVEFYHQVGSELGRVVGFLATLFAPQAIILSGEGTTCGGPLLDGVRTTLPQYAMSPQSSDVEVLLDEWDDHRWARGAASLVFDHVIFPASVRNFGVP